MFKPFMGFARNLFPQQVNRPTFNFSSLGQKSSPGANPNMDTPRPDFAARYQELLNDRPDTLAYREHARTGPPTVQRGNWAKLGAMLAGAATGFSSGDASAGYNLAMTSYYEPERRAQEQWMMRGQSLADLANLEQQEIDNRFKALGSEESAFYRGREDDRADRTLTHNINIDNQNLGINREQLRLQGLKTIQDKNTGETIVVDVMNPSRRIVLGKTDLTPQEEIEMFANRVAAERKAAEPYEAKADARRHANSLALVNRQGEIQKDITNTRASATVEAARQRMMARAMAMNPQDRGRTIILDITNASAADPILQNVDITKYLDFDSTGLPIVTQPSRLWGDSAEDNLVRQRLRELISQSLARTGSPAGGGNNQGNVNDDPMGIRGGAF